MKKHSRKTVSFPYTPALTVALGLVILLAGSGFAFAATQEGRDSFCASCHTQPESTYFQRAIDANPVDLASAHKTEGTRCIDCHSGAGLGGRARSELMGARNAVAWLTHTAKQPAPLTIPIRDDSCVKCHAQVTSRGDFENHFHVFLARWQNQDLKAGTCVSCHGGHSTDGSAREAFLNEPRTRAVCEACHNALGEGGERD